MVEQVAHGNGTDGTAYDTDERMGHWATQSRHRLRERYGVVEAEQLEKNYEASELCLPCHR